MKNLKKVSRDQLLTYFEQQKQYKAMYKALRKEHLALLHRHLEVLYKNNELLLRQLDEAKAKACFF